MSEGKYQHETAALLRSTASHALSPSVSESLFPIDSAPTSGMPMARSNMSFAGEYVELQLVDDAQVRPFVQEVRDWGYPWG
ncbi:hypothetical protein AB5N19_03204 [Seiridium cardinale]